MKGKTLAYLLLAVVLLIFGLGIWWVMIATSSQEEIVKGEVAYFLLVRAPEIKQFPLDGVIKEPHFGYSPPDGPQLKELSIYYLSSAPSKTIIRSIKDHLQGLGYVIGGDEVYGGIVFTNKDKTRSVEISIEDEGSFRKVSGILFQM